MTEEHHQGLKAACGGRYGGMEIFGARMLKEQTRKQNKLLAESMLDTYAGWKTSDA